MRQVVLDTETTGLETSQGHRIIELGGVELVDRRLTGNHFHRYINPQREIDEGALQVHGITTEFLADKPVFADVADEFLAFIGDAELIIHNAAFDLGFLDYELSLLSGGYVRVADSNRVLDSLALARQMHPGQRNNLDALCRRYGVDNAKRELHGALLDAEILADVYLAMTGGQVGLQLDASSSGHGDSGQGETSAIRRLPEQRPPIPVIRASEGELQAHHKRLEELDKAGKGAIWLRTGG